MSLARRRLADRALAFALSDRGASAAAVATHFSRCAEVGDMDAVDAALRAAEDADRALHYARAASWYQQALALLPAGEATLRPRALDRLSELAVQAGQMELGIAAAQELLAHTPGDELERRLVLMRRLAALRGVGGQPDTTRAVIEEALALAEHGDPGVAQMIVELTMVASIALGCREACQIARRAQAVAAGFGPAAASAANQLRAVEAHALAYAGEPRLAAQICEQGGAEAMAAFDAMALGMNLHCRAVALVLLGRFEEACAALDTLGEATEEIGLLFEAASTWAVRAEALVHLGRFDEALADALRGEDAARRVSGAATVKELAVIAGALALVHRGELDAAEQRLDQVRRVLDHRTSSFEASWWSVRALLLAARGDAPAAASSYARMWELAGALEAHSLLNARPGQIFALLDGDDAAAALAVARELQALLAERDLPRARPLAAIGLGAALIAAGDAVRGRAEVERGLALCDGVEGPLIPGESRLRAGEAMLAAGDRQRAGELLGEAWTLLDGCGAGWLRERTAAALRRAGVAGAAAPGRAAALPVAGVAALSAREHEVVRLAAAGLRSRAVGLRLGISERTVENHLASAYAKLGVHTRAELIAALARAS
jgi:DNA-binding CsgD family transcriptional regulator